MMKMMMIVSITVCHCLFLLHSLKPEVNDNKSETIVSFSKESGKKVIDPGQYSINVAVLW